jgi:cell division protein ZapE
MSEGALEEDPAQSLAVDRLQALHDALMAQNAPTAKRSIYNLRAFARGRRLFNGQGENAPRGLYLWGGVGRGKTLLMDLFFNHTDIAAKRRVHFHEFMAEIHGRIADWRASGAAARRRHKAYSRKAPDDPIAPVAHDIAREAALLCFDEFQVADIADAMILGRLFSALFDNGAVVVATSNRPPGDLYKDGLNRQLFLPFIDLLKSRMDVMELQAARDYRLAKLEEAPVYYAPLGRDADKAMDAAWKAMICGARERSETLRVNGRNLTVPRAARGAARFSFADLCAKPLGAEDYLAIARRYGAIYADRIPIMGPEMRDQAKRFVTLIDTLYDMRAKLVCSAAADPHALYHPAGEGAFEFERAVSRLMEMRSADYLAAGRQDSK